MRNHFVKLLNDKIDESQEDIYFLTGDLGYRVLEPIAERLKDRFINVGVAEQNMIGLASGLALSGKKVFVYSIVNFATFRCLEQIRNDICYHNLDVTIVVVGGGFAYGTHGYTHLGTEDLSAMMHLPHMNILVPGDKRELDVYFSDFFNHKGPKYLRMARGGEPDFSDSVDVSNFLELKDEKIDLLFLSQGPVAENCIKVTSDLSKKGISALTITVPQLRPFPSEKIAGFLKRSKNCIVVEEHAVGGGLGALVGVEASKLGKDCPKLEYVGIDPRVTKIIGRSEFLRESFGMDAASLYSASEKMLREGIL